MSCIGFLVVSTGSYHIAFIACGGVLFISAVLFFALPYITSSETFEEGYEDKYLDEKWKSKLPQTCEKEDTKDISESFPILLGHIVTSSSYKSFEDNKSVATSDNNNIQV